LNYKFWLKFEFFRVFTGIRGNRSSLPVVAADQSAKKKPSAYTSSQQEQYGLDLSRIHEQLVGEELISAYRFNRFLLESKSITATCQPTYVQEARGKLS
jgi:hypothetical protein